MRQSDALERENYDKLRKFFFVFAVGVYGFGIVMMWFDHGSPLYRVFHEIGISLLIRVAYGALVLAPPVGFYFLSNAVARLFASMIKR